jgi:hypothetical protein
VTEQGTFRRYVDINFRPERLDHIRRAAQIIAEYEAKGFAMSLRQLYYQLVSRGVIANEVAEYDRLGADVSDGRLAGLISWTAIEDRGRQLMGHHFWSSPRAAFAEAKERYRTDKWARQPVRPEVWVEKAALEGVVGDICGRLEVDFFACRGYNSQSEQWRAGRRFADRIRRGQRPVVLHLGDHDPSGLDMTRDNAERLSLFAGTPVQVIRLALNMPQVEAHRPPPNPAKVTDSRFADYARQYGDESWELDALPPKVLQGLISDAVMALRDERLWEEATEEENADRAWMADVIDEDMGEDDDDGH